ASRAGRSTPSRIRERLSIIVLPTSWTPSPLIPSEARFSTASGEVQSSRSETRSVTTRFTSSGMVQSRERSRDPVVTRVVPLFGRGQIGRGDPRLDVGDGALELAGGEGGRHGRVD